MYTQRDDELPHEVVRAIKRILDLQPGQSDDPLDTLSNDFHPADLLNSFFPDGMCISHLPVSRSLISLRGISGPD